MLRAAHLVIVKSTLYEHQLSLRSVNGSPNPRTEITEAGFVPGERVVLISLEDLERLLQGEQK
jgi:hypothetical protein